MIRGHCDHIVNQRGNKEQKIKKQKIKKQKNKKQPSCRFCFAVNFLNIQTEKRTYPIPREDCFCEGCTLGGGTGCGGTCETTFSLIIKSNKFYCSRRQQRIHSSVLCVY